MAGDEPPPPPALPAPHGVRVFISYSHKDVALRERLVDYFNPLQREGLVDIWDDREVAGADWARDIDDRLNLADVVLLLVTADFIRSDYCWGIEMTRALQRNADGADRAIVIPVILKRCDWESSPFARLQALPRGGRPLTDWGSEDAYYTAVAKGLRSRIRKLLAPGDSWARRVGGRLRDPRWWQRPAVWASTGAAVLAMAGVGGWAWLAGRQADAAVAQALQALRSGRYGDAVQMLQPACARLVHGNACFTLAKAQLGVQLERPDRLQRERFAQQVQALQAQAPDDPDLLLFAAELTLGESNPQRHPKALDDIVRAIRLAAGRYPEAHFYLATLQLMAGRHADALPLLDRAIESNATAPEHYLNTRAYARMRSGNTAGAIADYESSAELGSILSRIELAPLLWGRSDYERAADQLQAADRALAAADDAWTARNALPWVFELDGGSPLVLKQPGEKRCLTRWMLRAGAALAQRDGGGDAAAVQEQDCGARRIDIRAAVTAMLAQAARDGMDANGLQRGAAFASRHGLQRHSQGGS